MTNSANDPLTNLAQLTSALYSKGACMDNSYADSNAALMNTVRACGGVSWVSSWPPSPATPTLC